MWDLHVIDLGDHPTGGSQYSRLMIKWISGWKVQDLKHLLADDANMEEGKTILQE